MEHRSGQPFVLRNKAVHKTNACARLLSNIVWIHRVYISWTVSVPYRRRVFRCVMSPAPLPSGGKGHKMMDGRQKTVLINIRARARFHMTGVCTRNDQRLFAVGGSANYVSHTRFISSR